MDRRERLRAILNEAMELPTERWPALIEERCGGDAELRDEALRYLSEAGQLDSFLKQSARRDGRTLDLDRTHSVVLPPTAALPLGSTIATPGAAPAAAAGRDDSRPTYELLEVLGQGGFGIVFRANQLTPVRRPVAIKYLRPERATAAQDIRFEAERQALASLSHPGIAKLLDAGTTPDGRQYFSMEYVEGIPLDRFCDRRRSGIRERLDLLVLACDAIQHAHFRGIIHRDLKPGNILAFEQDGIPVVRVIDLGLALATEEPLTAGSRLLREGPGTGTPTHMSPEQWQRDPSEIDTRTDVYSLGVVLYDLLTGTLPLSLEEGMTLAGFGDRLTKGVPPAPSERFRSLPDEERREIAAARGLDPRGLERRLDPDLDAIARRALEKDPRDRYSSPEALAADLRRTFAYEPVSAHPSTFRYRARKFLRRNRLPVAAAAAILLITGVGLATSSAFWAVAREEQAMSRLLGDRETLATAPARLDELWPLGPEAVAPLEALRRRLGEVETRKDGYAERLRELREELDRGDARTQDLARFRVDVIEGVLAVVESFATDDGRDRYTDLRELAESPGRGLIAEIDWRLGHARTLDERTRSGAEALAAWESAAGEIAASPRYAGMPALAPQLGLLPLGFDPGSGLAEFWHVLSGTRPERDEEGRIRMRPEHGIVLVLVPAGTYPFGCEKPLAIEVTDQGGEVVVSVVVAGTAAESAGIAKDDRILAANGAPIATVEDFAALQQSLSGGGEVELSIRAAASGVTVSRRLRAEPPGPGRIVDLGARSAEGPTRTVELDPYFISKYEITQSQWTRWTGKNPSTQSVGLSIRGREHTADQPAETMAWADANRVCREMGLRLPTEPQWEAACRAGTLTPWHSGEGARDIAGYANVADLQVELAKISGWAIEDWLDDGHPVSAPVGSFTPNRFGLHDTMGNVWEWCAERARGYDEEEHPFRPGDGARPAEIDTPNRVIRGGGFANTADFARSSRRWNYQVGGDQDVGVRPVRPLDPAPLRDGPGRDPIPR